MPEHENEVDYGGDGESSLIRRSGQEDSDYKEPDESSPVGSR